jgi:nitroreductase
MEVRQAILTKRAVREFRPDPLPVSITHAILNAGRRAQSAKNTQPWRFIAVQDRQRLQALSECGTYAGHVAGAALAIAILTPDPAQRWSILFDAGQAASYMQLAGWELGVGSCPATFYEPEKVRKILGFSEEFHTRVALSFGFPADPNALTNPPQLSGRRPFDDTVRFETWD